MSTQKDVGPDLSLALEPQRLEDGRVAFDVEGVRVTLTPRGTGWDYERPGFGRPVHVAGMEGALPRFLVRVAVEDGIARFANPVFVPGSQAIDLWVAWPLEVVVVVGDDEQLDRLAPGFRKTLFGTVNEGVVMPAAVCAALSGPDDEETRGRPLAALAVRVRNASPEPAKVSRVPVAGASLALHRKGTSFAVGGVRTEVHGDGRAEATTKPSEPPAGFTRVARAQAATHGSNLGWLLDATKRSVEFPL